MNSIKRHVPDSWVLSNVDEVYEVIGGGTPSTKVSEYWAGSIPWITSADIEGVRDIKISRFITDEAISNSTTNKVPPGSLLVVTRVGLGKIAIADQPICFSQDLQALIQSDDLLVAEFTLYFLSYELQILKFEGRGTTISGLTKKQLKDLPFPLPPLNEQHRIVAKIEELFSELEKGVESLKTAKAQLAVYRQSVLKAAFEGRLTESWRKKHAAELESADELLSRIKTEREARYEAQFAEWQQSVTEWEATGGKSSGAKKPAKPKKPKEIPPLTADELANLPELPESWVWTKFEGLLEHITSGSRGWANYYSEAGALFIRAQNLKYDRLDLDDVAYVKLPDSAEGKRTLTKAGDLLITITGANVTKSALITKPLGEAYVSQHVALCRLLITDMGKYLFAYMICEAAGRKQLNSAAYGAGKPGLNLDNIKNVLVPLASMEEHHKIIQEIESRFSVVEKMEQTIEESLQKAEALRQSILKRAFEGKLVPQDSNDEPASELLARIRAERAKVAPKPRRKRKEAA